MSADSSRAERLRRWFFPREVELPEHARQVLSTVYPTLDLGAVRFHLGVPHVFNAFATEGITLPGRLRPHRTRIYVEPRFWDPGSVKGLGLLVHEAFHALQLQEAGPGLGLARPFMVLYLACAAGNGFRYDGHPMEKDAYELESRFDTTFREGPVAPDSCACLAAPSSGLGFWRKLAASTPGWRKATGAVRVLLAPWVVIWFLLWSTAVAVLAVAKGTVESLGAVAVGVLRLLPEPSRS